MCVWGGRWIERVTSRQINKQKDETLKMRKVENVQQTREVGAVEQNKQRKRMNHGGKWTDPTTPTALALLVF